jgi:large subunit ribosomal protein L17
MRHQVAGKHLSRTSSHRKALRRNLAASLFEHGTISTTREKAKFVKPFAEKLITLGRDGSLHARRRAIALLQDRAICRMEDGESVKVGSVIQKLFGEIGPQFADRNGGYTRIINLPLRRVGDNGRLVLLQLVGELKESKTVQPTKKVETAPVEVEADVVEAPAVDVDTASDESAESKGEESS